MKKAVSRSIRLLLSVVIIAALVLFARKVNWQTTWQSIVSANRTILLLAALVNLLSLALKGVRWWIFLRPVGAPSLWMALKATFAGAGLNNVLVANGGEAARVVFVARAAHVQSAKVLATLALERMFELIGYVVMLALAVSFLDLPSSLSRAKPFAWAGLALIAVFLVYLVRRPDIAESAAPLAAEVTGAIGWRSRVANYFRHFGHTIGGISTGPRFGMALLISVSIWALQVWTYALTARSAHFNLSPVGTVAALLAVNLGFAVRATPGNVGVFQAVYALTAVGFGMDKDQAIAVAFLIQTQQIIPVTLLGIALAPEFIFKRKQVVRAEDRGLDLHSRSPESADD
ncbi:MAG TPA: lysylphosphatidylglycerol synthase transmembrane domain-containing protein [Gemmatimonadaceae bacterium]|nr:lysylphosphatidylglycerol synthase transmembrane domain-containing protein [Gemmatimonadaceae bacterium]